METAPNYKRVKPWCIAWRRRASCNGQGRVCSRLSFSRRCCLDRDSLQAATPQHARWLAPEWGPSAVTDYDLASFQRRPADQFRGCLGRHLIMCTFTPSTGRETTLAGSRIRTVNAPIGACEIIPAGADYWGALAYEERGSRFHVRPSLAEQDRAAGSRCFNAAA